MIATAQADRPQLSLRRLCVLLGVSRAWWRDNHDAHHAHPNELGQDPNVNIIFLGCTPEQALSRPSWVQWIIRHQVALIVPIFRPPVASQVRAPSLRNTGPPGV